MEKLYVKEIRPDGEVSTVGLFYSRTEAESIVARLRSLPERRRHRYDIVQANQTYLPTRNPQRSGAGSEG